MKIFTNCSNAFCRNKFYLSTTAKTRTELSNSIGFNISVSCPHCNNFGVYIVNNFYAEAEKKYVPKVSIGALIGGVFGIVAGPAGIIFGFLAGGGAGGAVSYKLEQDEVNRFNNSYIY